MSTPPPPPYGPPPDPRYPPPPPQPYSSLPGQNSVPLKKSPVHKWVLIGLAVFVTVVLAAVAAIYFLVGRDSTDAVDVKAGDCLKEIPDSSRVLYVNTVTCDQPHKGEVFAVMPMPDGDFPGDAAVVKYTDKCAPALAGHAPGAAGDPGITLFVLYPTADSWQRGDRTVTCIATSDPPRTGKLG